MNNSISNYMQNAVNGISNSLNSNTSGEISLKTTTDSVLSKIGEMANLPSMEELSSIDWSSIGSILSALGAAILLILFSTFVLYILKGIGLYTINKRQGNSLAWLSFIPYGCFYTFCKAVGKTKLYSIEVEHPEFLLPAIVLAGILPYTKALCMILFVLVFYGLLYRLYQNKVPSFATVLLILSILLPILPPIFIFAIRKK